MANYDFSLTSLSQEPEGSDVAAHRGFVGHGHPPGIRRRELRPLLQQKGLGAHSNAQATHGFGEAPGPAPRDGGAQPPCLTQTTLKGQVALCRALLRETLNPKHA